MEKVQVYLMVGGDYCAFHEMSFRVVYDITNDIKLGSYDKKTLADWDYNDDGGGYSDVQRVSAIKDGNRYYLAL